MKWLKPTIPPVVAIIVIFFVLTVVSVIDIFLVFLYSRFYSNALFLVTFGVGGLFAAVLGYAYGVKQAHKKNEVTRWSLVATLVGCGLLFFFFLSKVEGGEYAPAFRAFGVTLIVASLLFVRGNVDL